MKSVTVKDVPGGAQLIDVRETDEFAEVHAVGAINVPLSELVSRVDEIDDDQDVYVICRSGGRSQKAAEFLIDKGLENIINVEGGTLAWIDAGLPTEAEPETSR